jgi:hypothetical protein
MDIQKPQLCFLATVRKRSEALKGVAIAGYLGIGSASSMVLCSLTAPVDA